MALLRRTAHRSKILAIHLVHCRPPAGGGDDCLSIELAPPTVQEIYGAETLPDTCALLEAPRLHASRLLVRVLPHATSACGWASRAIAISRRSSAGRSARRRQRCAKRAGF